MDSSSLRARSREFAPRLILMVLGLAVAPIADVAETATAGIMRRQPLAPIADLGAPGESSSMAITMLERVVVPARDVVGVPAYPNASIVQTLDYPQSTPPYASVRLISEADPVVVATWYKEKLQSMQHQYAAEFEETVFWSGDLPFSSRVVSPATLPDVTILPDRSMYSLTWPETRTIIDIRYPLPTLQR